MKEQIKFCVWSVAEKGSIALYRLDIQAGNLSTANIVKKVLNTLKEKKKHGKG